MKELTTEQKEIQELLDKGVSIREASRIVFERDSKESTIRGWINQGILQRGDTYTHILQINDLPKHDTGSLQYADSVDLQKPREFDNSRILVISDMHIPYHHPDALEFLQHLKDKYQPTRVISMGDECFPANAEVMTEDGWMTFEDLHRNPKRVMQVFSDLTMSLVTPDRFIFKESAPELLEYSHSTMYSCTTPRHNLVKKHPVTGVLHRREAWDIEGNSAWAIPRTATYSGGSGWPLQKEDIQLLVAFQADGTFTKGAARFGFKKETKFNRLKTILENLEIGYNVHTIGRGDLQIYIEKANVPNYLRKDFSELRATDGTTEQLRTFMLEIAEWDSAKIDSKRLRYTSTVKANVEFVHTVGALCGYNVRRVSKCVAQEQNHSTPYYLDIIYEEDEKCSFRTAKVRLLEHNKPVYCVTVPSGMILTRQNGWMSVSGNCDKHALSYHDSDPDLSSAGDELRKSIPIIKELEAMFPVMDILDSNHGSLVWRKAKTHGIPRHYIKSYNDVLGVSRDWVWHNDLTVKLPNGSNCYFHHGKTNDVIKLSQQMGMNCVQGHYHESFKVDYWGNPTGLFWGMQTACLINDKSYAFSYNNVNIKRPIIGTGLIIDSLPVLEPMLLGNDGRWTLRKQK